MQIEDDFLDASTFKTIQNLVLSDYFPWFYNRSILYGNVDDNDYEKEHFQFTHRLFDKEAGGVLSEAISEFDPLFEKIGMKELLRAKLNLGYRAEEAYQGGWHTDLKTSPYKTLTTAVFYLNTNNGYTEFKDGTIVDSIENRIAAFDTSLEHTGVSQTDKQVRVLLNLNYIV